MSSKDLTLDLVNYLDLLKKNGTDYLLVAIDPGKNVDRADIFYELKDKDSPKNLLDACLSLFANIYDKECLIDTLLEYCENLDNAYGNDQQIDPDITEIIKEATQKKPRKKKLPPPTNDTGQIPSI